MPALRQLLAAHGHLLALDTASATVQAGVLRASGEPHWQRVEGEAGTALFQCADAALGAARQQFDGIGAFVFCEGPGSMLGVRTVAMALRTWHVLEPRPVYAYQSLAVAAVAEWRRAPRAFTIIADARRDTWHTLAMDAAGRPGALQRTATPDLPGGELLTPENFRTWSKLARPVASCSYDLAPIFAALGERDLFRAVEFPDAFQHEPPEYRKWPARVHSAATAAKS